MQSDTPVMKGCQSEVIHPTPDVDLGDPTEDQKIAVATMLREEAESFSKDDDDVGCAEGLQLKINLSDNRPVQKIYTSIPKPLYSEVKQYVEDLLNRGWVRKSRSAYSSPVVCVRKRDGSLRLTGIHSLGYKQPLRTLVGTSGFLFWTKEKPTIRDLSTLNVNT